MPTTVQAIANVPDLPENLAAIFENCSNQPFCFIYFLLSLDITCFVVLPVLSDIACSAGAD
jgi:hypothetical protein